MSASGGYGICGARNVYSSHTKLDNWVEDEIGAILASQPRPAYGEYTTVQRLVHCHPDDMIQKKQPKLNLPTTLELIAKNKEGTPYQMLFGHGKQYLDPNELFQSMARLTMSGSNSDLFRPLPEKFMEMQKAKKVKRETDLAYKKCSESRKATSYITPIESRIPNKAIGEASALPDFRRRGGITATR